MMKTSLAITSIWPLIFYYIWFIVLSLHSFKPCPVVNLLYLFWYISKYIKEINILFTIKGSFWSFYDFILEVCSLITWKIPSVFHPVFWSVTYQPTLCLFCLTALKFSVWNFNFSRSIIADLIIDFFWFILLKFGVDLWIPSLKYFVCFGKLFHISSNIVSTLFFPCLMAP